MFFTLPEDARWNADRQAVEFGVEIGEYRGVVRVPGRVRGCCYQLNLECLKAKVPSLSSALRKPCLDRRLPRPDRS